MITNYIIPLPHPRMHGIARIRTIPTPHKHSRTEHNQDGRGENRGRRTRDGKVHGEAACVPEQTVHCRAQSRARAAEEVGRYSETRRFFDVFLICFLNILVV